MQKRKREIHHKSFIKITKTTLSIERASFKTWFKRIECESSPRYSSSGRKFVAQVRSIVTNAASHCLFLTPGRNLFLWVCGSWFFPSCTRNVFSPKSIQFFFYKPHQTHLIINTLKIKKVSMDTCMHAGYFIFLRII